MPKFKIWTQEKIVIKMYLKLLLLFIKLYLKKLVYNYLMSTKFIITQ